MSKILAAAELIAAARRDRRPLEPLPADIVPRHEADGYRVQDAVHDILTASAGRLAGYKIGCTSPVMQQYLGIPHPCGGGVFASGIHASGANLHHRDFVRVGVECEIAVRLGRDLDAAAAPFTADTIARAVDAYY
ncbi:MAG: hydratase, partial [Proteobacteria bacterium]|nr:hydratase [Pseudomonadota bacterium]